MLSLVFVEEVLEVAAELKRLDGKLLARLRGTCGRSNTSAVSTTEHIHGQIIIIFQLSGLLMIAAGKWDFTGSCLHSHANVSEAATMAFLLQQGCQPRRHWHA